MDCDAHHPSNDKEELWQLKAFILRTHEHGRLQAEDK